MKLLVACLIYITPLSLLLALIFDFLLFGKSQLLFKSIILLSKLKNFIKK